MSEYVASVCPVCSCFDVHGLKKTKCLLSLLSLSCHLVSSCVLSCSFHRWPVARQVPSSGSSSGDGEAAEPRVKAIS